MDLIWWYMETMNAAPGPSAPLFEEWRPVVGAEGYEVSSEGRLRNVRTARVLARTHNGSGYLESAVGRRTNRKRLLVHRVVMAAFVGPCPDGHEVAHLNGVRDDARLCNLMYATPAVNASHKSRHRRTSALTWDVGVKVHADYVAGEMTIAEIAEKHGISSGAVCRVGRCKGRWQKLGPPPPQRKPAPEFYKPRRRPPLSWTEVDAIRYLYSIGVKNADLARAFGVSHTAIKERVRSDEDGQA